MPECGMAMAMLLRRAGGRAWVRTIDVHGLSATWCSRATGLGKIAR